MATEVKVCRHCRQELPISRFSIGPMYRGGRYHHCKTCRLRYKKPANKEDPAKVRRRNLLKTHGITQDEYQVMLAQQDGQCAICFALPTASYHGVLHVDHDHVTGQIRGLLCSSCNLGIGQLGDSPGRLRAAACYLDTRR